MENIKIEISLPPEIWEFVYGFISGMSFRGYDFSENLKKIKEHLPEFDSVNVDFFSLILNNLLNKGELDSGIDEISKIFESFQAKTESESLKFINQSNEFANSTVCMIELITPISQELLSFDLLPGDRFKALVSNQTGNAEFSIYYNGEPTKAVAPSGMFKIIEI